MYDDLSDDVGVFDFDEFADHLVDQGIEASPAQMHGCLTGLLSAGGSQEPEFGLDALTQILSLAFHGELASRIMQLYRVTCAALQDEAFSFYPLLPDDDHEIALRAEALANWCEGFLSGFAYRIAGAQIPGEVLSDEIGEVLRDIAAMAQAEAAEDESEEDAEESYTELVEYLRVAVVNVFLDRSTEGGEPDMPTEPARHLH